MSGTRPAGGRGVAPAQGPYRPWRRRNPFRFRRGLYTPDAGTWCRVSPAARAGSPRGFLLYKTVREPVRRRGHRRPGARQAPAGHAGRGVVGSSAARIRPAPGYGRTRRVGVARQAPFPVALASVRRHRSHWEREPSAIRWSQASMLVLDREVPSRMLRSITPKRAAVCEPGCLVTASTPVAARRSGILSSCPGIVRSHQWASVSNIR